MANEGSLDAAREELLTRLALMSRGDFIALVDRVGAAASIPLVGVSSFEQASELIRYVEHRDGNTEALRARPVGRPRTPPTLWESLRDRMFGGIDRATAQANRSNFLKLVRNTWIHGVLDRSLHRSVLMQLGLGDRDDLLARPWTIYTHDEAGAPAVISQRLLDVLDESSGSLLILGAPGAGKTTMLLDLARDTIERAEERPDAPIPAVLNLSTWAAKREPLRSWVEQELHRRYQIPLAFARYWVREEALLLLLDGLDEVAERHRSGCVEAINTFCRTSTMPVVVCCRTLDYTEAPARLQLRRAVELAAPSLQQVVEHLDAVGPSMAGLRASLLASAELGELARTPLVLSVMMATAQGHEEAAAPDLREIYRRYIRMVLRRRGLDTRWRPESTVRYLRALARFMGERGVTGFALEDLDRSSALVRVLVAGFIGIVWGSWLGRWAPPTYWQQGALVAFAILSTVLWSHSESTARPPSWSWPELRRTVGSPLWVGFCAAMVIFGWTVQGVTDVRSFGSMLLVFVAIAGIEKRDIDVSNAVGRGLRESLRAALLAGTCGAVLFYVTHPTISRAQTGFIAGAVLFGGTAIAQHYLTRLLLAANGALPFRLADFLAHAHRCALLHRAGGSYLFLHRTLLEHFASLSDDEVRDHVPA